MRDAKGPNCWLACWLLEGDLGMLSARSSCRELQRSRSSQGIAGLKQLVRPTSPSNSLRRLAWAKLVGAALGVEPVAVAHDRSPFELGNTPPGPDRRRGGHQERMLDHLVPRVPLNAPTVGLRQERIDRPAGDDLRGCVEGSDVSGGAECKPDDAAPGGVAGRGRVGGRRQDDPETVPREWTRGSSAAGPHVPSQPRCRRRSPVGSPCQRDAGRGYELPSSLAQLAHCAVHSPASCPVMTLSRFQVLMAAIQTTSAARAASS